VADQIEEDYNEVRYARTEEVPGAFVEFTWKPQARLTGIVGFRYDRHNLYGNFYTPRFHLKYALMPETNLRLSAGKGYRSPYIFVENLTILASSRTLQFVETPAAEEAWNYGVQLTQDFQLTTDRPATVNVDFYRTDFQNRVIVDTEQKAGQIYIYNLDGRSYSNAAQIEMNATLFDGFVTTLAYRWNDVKMTINGKLVDQPLTNRTKGLLVFSFQTPGKKWQLDFTTQLNGKTRLPSTAINPEKYQLAEYSPAYAMLFGQIKRNIKNMEIYLGLENITNYRQANPILAWQEPFSPYFDSSLIWGSTTGRRVYVGIRVN
jgi:outer membrane receptor for ferrienterochelin and colicin